MNMEKSCILDILGGSVEALMVPEFPAYNYSFSAKT